MNVKNILKSIGLTKEEEVEILTLLYKESNLKVSEIAKKVSIPRTSIYVHLESLEDKGFVKRTKKGTVLSFTPVDPENIQEDLEEKASTFNEALPFLKQILELPTKRPEVTFLESKSGIETIYRDMIRSSKKGEVICVIESSETVKENLERLSSRFISWWQKKFIEKNIVTKGIVTGDTSIFKSMSENFKKLLKQRSATIRLLDSNNLPFLVNLYLIRDNKVYIFVPQKDFVMKVESQEIYKSLLTFFEITFEKARPVKLAELIS